MHAGVLARWLGVLALAASTEAGSCIYGYEKGCAAGAPPALKERCKEADNHWRSYDFGLVREYQDRLVQACKPSARAEPGSGGGSSLWWTESQYGPQRNFALGTNIIVDSRALKERGGHFPGTAGLLSGMCSMVRPEGEEEWGFSWGGHLKVLQAKNVEARCSTGRGYPRPILLVARETIVSNVFHVLTDVDMAFVSMHAGGLASNNSGAFDIVFLDHGSNGNGYDMWAALNGGRAPLRMQDLASSEHADSSGRVCFPTVVFSVPSRSSFHYGFGLNPPCGTSALLRAFADRQVAGAGLGDLRDQVAARALGDGGSGQRGSDGEGGDGEGGADGDAATAGQVDDSVDTGHERKGRKKRKRALTLTLGVRKTTGYGRRMTNQEEVLAALKKSLAGVVRVRAVDFGELDWASQMRVAVETDVYVGMHGAGMTHLMWLPNGASVVEMFPKDHEDLDYWKLASMLGHSYSNWTNTHAAKNWVPEGKTAVFGDVEVTVGELLAVVKKAVAARERWLYDEKKRLRVAARSLGGSGAEGVRTAGRHAPQEEVGAQAGVGMQVDCSVDFEEASSGGKEDEATGATAAAAAGDGEQCGTSRL